MSAIASMKIWAFVIVKLHIPGGCNLSTINLGSFTKAARTWFRRNTPDHASSRLNRR